MIGELGAARATLTLVENIKTRNQVFKLNGVPPMFQHTQNNVWGQLTAYSTANSVIFVRE